MTRAMHFGIHHLMSCGDGQSPRRLYREAIDQAVHAERLGFESVWPVEHHFDRQVSISPAPALLLAAIAERTRTLRLGTAIVQLPLSHPLRVAEELAALDVLSGGRVECGVGRGSNPAHFAGYGVPLGESRERFEEALAFIGCAWRDERFTFRGRFHQARELALSPRPLQQPHPPIRVAANSSDTARFAGRVGLPVIVATNINPFPRLRPLLAEYREARAAAGHPPPTPDDITLLMPVFVADGPERVRATVEPSVLRFAQVAAQALQPALAKCPPGSERERLALIVARLAGLTFEEVRDSMGLLDTPAGCVARLAQLQHELGPGRVIAWFNFGGAICHQDVCASMALFAAEVMPRFQPVWPQAAA
jgi:alkanesulfonate monooxygenase SsuD/methylene tetrahydromethanopterin reductase-like flavin-dependent oxidoreductase (luciferase family)